MWDRTVNVHKRPAWLRAAASVTSVTPQEEKEEVQEDADGVEVDLFWLSTQADPETWDSSQVALNETQLSNKQDVQLQQLEAMRQRLALQAERIEQQHAEQQREQALQAARFEQQRAEQLRNQAEQVEKLRELQEPSTNRIPTITKTRNCACVTRVGCLALTAARRADAGSADFANIWGCRRRENYGFGST